jgi:hypothetical protein
MKKFLVVLMILAVAMGAFAQEIAFSGQVETGVKITQTSGDGVANEDWNVLPYNDDSGIPGRADLNVEGTLNNYGAKFKLRADWDGGAAGYFSAPYAFAYGNFLGEKFKVSAGLLDDSAWATGGDFDGYIDSGIWGVRFEIKPIAGLNVGFVLNNTGLAGNEIGDFFQETIIGAKYDIENLFSIVAAIKLDSDGDEVKVGDPADTADDVELQFGIDIKAVENLTAIIDGAVTGLGDFSNSGLINAHEKFGYQITDAIDAGILLTERIWGNSDNDFYLDIKPSFGYKINDLISIGLSGLYGFGNDGDDNYNSLIKVTPSCTFNVGPTATINGYYQLVLANKDVGGTSAATTTNNIVVDFRYSF